MDDTMKHTFEIATDAGPPLTVTATRPTEAQMFVLALSRESVEGTERMRLIRRLMRVLELLIGQQQWDDVIETAMLEGRMAPTELAALAMRIFTFDWASLEKAQNQPGDSEEVINGSIANGA
jgi:hypothetical protein